MVVIRMPVYNGMLCCPFAKDEEEDEDYKN